MVGFEAVLILAHPDRPFTYIVLSPAASAAFPAKGMTPAEGTVNGHPFEEKVQPMKDGTHRLYIPKALREAAGVAPGDTVEIDISPAPPD